MTNVPALFGVILATIGNSNCNLAQDSFFPSSFLLLPNWLRPQPNIFQNLLHRQKLQQAAKWEWPGWKGREAHLCSLSLAWCQTAVQLGVALINSSVLCFIGHLSLVPQRRWTQGWKASRIKDVKRFNRQLRLLGFALKHFCFLWLFWWSSSFQTDVAYEVSFEGQPVTIQFPGSDLMLNP